MFGLMLTLAVGACAVENARYVLRDDTDTQARFLAVASGPHWPAQVALRVHSSRTGGSAWFLPWSDSSDDSQHMASTADVTAPGWQAPDPDGGPRPLGDVGYIGTDATYRVLSELPRAGMPAPAHFLLPDLRQALWYRAAPGQRQAIARQFFGLVSCVPR